MQLEECSLGRTEGVSDAKNLFEDCAWLYELCREYLFRDHTEKIVQSLFSAGLLPQPTQILEVGCGRGFYSRRLAPRCANLRLLGVDRSSRMVSSAQRRAVADNLANCRFLVGDAEDLCDFVAPSTLLSAPGSFLLSPTRGASSASSLECEARRDPIPG